MIKSDRGTHVMLHKTTSLSLSDQTRPTHSLSPTSLGTGGENELDIKRENSKNMYPYCIKVTGGPELSPMGCLKCAKATPWSNTR